MGTPAQLPDDVIVEILLRLPLHYIPRCRAVCRAWRSAISHPSFERSHAERPATVSIAEITTNLQRYVYGVEGTRLVTGKLSTAIAFEFFRDGFRRSLWFATPSYAFVLGSWDGVVCVERGNWPHHCFHFYVDHYVLWNPLTMACATVYTPDGHIIGGYAHPETRRFHLVQASGRTHRDLLLPTVFRILRVGDAAWRELPLPGNISSQTQTAQLCMNIHVPRFARLHGNLHWLLEPSMSQTLQLLAFDMSREEFWTVGTPARRGGLAMARIGLVSAAGKLCIFVVLPWTSTLEMWVLDRYSDRPPAAGSWQLRERISLITLDRSDLSRTFSVTTQVEVVEGGVRDGEEVFLVQHAQGRIDAYNVQRKAWRMVKASPSTFTRDVWVVMHKECVLNGDVSFGEASRGLAYWVDYYGQPYLYCLS